MTYKVLSNINVEITRKCNLKCAFCHKGKAQNLTISKEVIDKSVTELKDVYIQSIQFSGGEPTLEPEMFDYLIHKIIESKLKIGFVGFFTNGIKTDERILSSLNMLLDYLHSEKYPEMLEEAFESTYRNRKQRMTVIISDYMHKNENNVSAAKDFYNKITKDDYSVFLQSELLSNNCVIDIAGNAEINYDTILKTPLSINSIRVPVTEYFIINSIGENIIYTEDLIHIGANGNIYLNAAPYEQSDRNPMFNILDCNFDFWEKLNNWCWLHPIGKKAKAVLETYKTLQFCRDKQIKITENIESLFETINVTSSIIHLLENAIFNIHRQYSKFTFSECENLAVTIIYSHLVDSFRYDENLAVTILSSISDYDFTSSNKTIISLCGTAYFLKLKAKYGYVD